MAVAISPQLEKIDALLKCPNPNLADIQPLITQLKIALTALPSLQPASPFTDASLKEVGLARRTYELAAVTAAYARDVEGFERNMAQAKNFYVDYRTLLPPSEMQPLLIGLNLMRLLSQSMLAEFHTEIELVPQELRNNENVSFAMRLETYLMEGSYSKIIASKMECPHESFTFFFDALKDTVRNEIADCAEKAYKSLDMTVVAKLLYLDSGMDAFIAERGWSTRGAEVVFGDGSSAGVSLERDLPSMELIRRTIGYARELERIV